MSLFEINGTPYSVGTINITRTATINRTENGITLDGRKHNTPKGTYYDYEVTIATRGMDVSEYDSLYEALTAPVEYINLTLPYGQTSINFDAKINVSNDSIKYNSSTIRKWSELKFTCEAMEPQRAVES